MFKSGDIVRIKPEWCEFDSELTKVFIVVEWNEDRGRIRDFQSPMSIKPISLVRLEWLELVESAENIQEAI